MTAGASRGNVEARRAFRGTIVRREIPGGLTLSGLAVIAISLINWVIPPRGAPADYFVTIALGLLFVGAAAVMRREWIPATALPWIWIVLANLLVGLLLVQYWMDPRPVNLVWVIAVTVTFLPVVGDWAAAWVGGAVALAMTSAAVWAWSVPDTVEYVLVAVSSVAIGLILLRRRLSIMDALADAQAAVEDSASTDALTGVFNRRGLQEHFDGMAALARRSGQPLFAAFVDVRGLKAANDAHGHDFGDTVIICVADALRSSVRASDVLGRWGGDEFVILGLGDAPTSDELEERVRSHALAGGVDASRWSAGVTVGVATCGPSELAPAELIRRSDQAMYGRRRERGDTGR